MNVWAWSSYIKLSVSAKMDMSLGWDFLNIKWEIGRSSPKSRYNYLWLHELVFRSSKVPTGPVLAVILCFPKEGFSRHIGASIVYQGSENPQSQ